MSSKRENTYNFLYFEFIKKNPSGLAHGFPSAEHDKMEDAFCVGNMAVAEGVDCH